MFQRFKSQLGANMLEIGVITALVLIISLAALQNIGEEVSYKFCEAGQELTEEDFSDDKIEDTLPTSDTRNRNTDCTIMEFDDIPECQGVPPGFAGC